MRCCSALNNLAAAYGGLKKYKKALHYSSSALDIEYGHSDKDGPLRLTLLASNSLYLLKTGSKKEALAQADEVYQKALRLLGERHITTLYALTFLSAARLANGELEIALLHSKKAYEIASEQYGKRHYHTENINKYYKKARFKKIFRIGGPS